MQTVSQFADGDRHTARAEVVAALNEAAGILAAEQALQFALNGRVALLHLGTAGFQARQFVRLGRTRCAADAVTARAAAQ